MRRHAPFVRAIIVACFIVFLWEIATMGVGLLSGNVSILALVNAGALVPSLVLVQGQWWRIASSAFLHASILHIGLNMFSLWVIGSFIEPILGSRRTALVYIASLIASGLGVIYFSAANTATLGASG
ncbi:MAG TPA: rhomboid family intramembrane serine protease, partial [Candidatus Dormibacteraeota bacterium]|nr:rhomboid family intramembrane serine protease [Candidatus Dormibacteraeota bacterium]